MGTDERTGTGRRPGRHRRLSAGAVIVIVAALLFPAASSPAQQAGPRPAAQDPRHELARLKQRADKLAKDYRGRIETLSDAQRAAKRAVRRADRIDGERRAALAKVRRMAAGSYMNGSPVDDAAVRLMFGGQDTDTGDIATVEHFARDSGQRVRNLRRLSTQAAHARRTASGNLGTVRKQVGDLEKRRTRVRELLTRYKPEKPSKPSKPSRPSGPAHRKKKPTAPDRVRHGTSPIVGDYTTPRMRRVRDEIDAKFGPFTTIGCYRPGDPQDHGSGRACDFMESTDGQMPNPTAQAHGDRVARYAIDNASRLGIKYVIWKQRIHDVRSGGGWKPMEDRGSVTQNHHDHVHISVL